jgi:DNA-binding MarR family transcriptional regulator
MRHAGLSYRDDGYVIRSLHKKGLVIVSDNKYVGDRVIKITSEGTRRLNSAKDMITSQELTDDMPKYFGMRQRQVIRLFRRTPVLTARSINLRLGIERRNVEMMLAKLYRYQFITNIDDQQFVLIERGLRWLDDDCTKRGIKRYPSVEE